jgi:hypothetical protein
VPRITKPSTQLRTNRIIKRPFPLGVFQQPASLVVFDSNLPKADEKHMTLRIKNLTACIKERRIDV